MLYNEYGEKEIRSMRVTVKGQVTIPIRLRNELDLRPGTRVTLEECDGGVLIRHALSREELIRQRIEQVKGIAKGRFTTDELMNWTRGED